MKLTHFTNTRHERSRMDIAIEYIHWLQEERARINRVSLSEIVFFENGMKVSVSDEAVSDFEATGLNNTDFITSKFYK